MKPLIKNLREIIAKRDVSIISFLLLCGLFLEHGCDSMYLFMPYVSVSRLSSYGSCYNKEPHHLDRFLPVLEAGQSKVWVL